MFSLIDISVMMLLVQTTPVSTKQLLHKTSVLDLFKIEAIHSIPHIAASQINALAKQQTYPKHSKHKLTGKKLRKKKRIYFNRVRYSTFSNLDTEAHVGDDTSVADALARKVKVLCWVMTYPKAHETRARHVKETWGKRCNILLFMSTEEDSSLPTVKLPVPEGYKTLWGKTKAAFRYIYERYRKDADWFIRTDDNTYLVVENLRYLLADYNYSKPVCFGHQLKAYTPQGYMSGGAGIVISRAALDKFVTEGLNSPDMCTTYNDRPDDLEMSKCFYKIGVKVLDSRDNLLRGRFFPFMPYDHIIARRDESFWYWQYSFYPTVDGIDCCSEFGISFHYVLPEQMYMFDYFLYHLRPYGISARTDDLPKILRDLSS